MRTALYQHLTANCTTIPTWRQPYTATADTPKPYGVIVIGEVMRSPFNRLGSFRDLYVWPYFGGSSYVPVDAAVTELRALLSDTMLTTAEGNRFAIEFTHEGKDFYDDALKALTRRLEFRIPQAL